MIQIDFLADHLQQVTTLAQWHHTQWQELIPDWTLEDAERELAGHTDRDAIPTTLVALDAVGVIGSASVLVEDFPEWAEFTPWLASVYVVPAWRGRGVGSRLVNEAVSVAGRVGARAVFLGTPGQVEFYRRIGWSVLDLPARGDRGLTLMTRPAR